ncbi:MAG: hypothetical protein L6Q51_09685 [Cyclobacteriaceae bacterium]|nr:hypothetical protein [Cyclobacteriaceae bacterium]
MKNHLALYLTAFILVITVYACRQSEYERLVSSELARNVRYDSLFLGLRFNMSSKEFYSACWEMNKQGLIMQGPGNLSVQYQLDSSQMRSLTYMWFYPDFKNDSIYKMPVEFQYVYWSPVFQPLSADSLLVDVKNLFEKWYGGSFLYQESKDGLQKVWVKVDGNRRIRLYKKNISTVSAEFLDLQNAK